MRQPVSGYKPSFKEVRSTTLPEIYPKNKFESLERAKESSLYSKPDQ